MTAQMTITQNRVIGIAPSNAMAHKKGLDEIDKWAMGVGACEKALNAMTIHKKGKKKRVIRKRQS